MNEWGLSRPLFFFFPFLCAFIRSKELSLSLALTHSLRVRAVCVLTGAAEGKDHLYPPDSDSEGEDDVQVRAVDCTALHTQHTTAQHCKTGRQHSTAHSEQYSTEQQQLRP